MEINLVIIDDNVKLKNDPIIWEFNDVYGKENVDFFLTPEDGIAHVKNNINRNMIILLDIDFPKNQSSGHQILEEITSISKLIPVILWSGINEYKEEFSDFINNQAFGFLSKTATSEEILLKIQEAELSLSSNVDNAIEDWIIGNPNDKDRPVFHTLNGKSLTLNDILIEIRNQTQIGKEFTKKFNALTIHLLLENKENLND